MSLYFAVDRRAVLAFFNPFKTEQFGINYFSTVLSLRDNDQHSIKCLRSIFCILLFVAISQLYLYLFPSQWHHKILFDIFDQSNNYPSLLKFSMFTIILMTAYMFYMHYYCIASEKCFKLVSEYYLKDSHTFVSTPSSGIKKLIFMILNVYQVFPIVAVPYICLEYVSFTSRIFQGDSILVWTRWIEFLSMSIFFVAITSACCLFIFISYTSILCAALSVGFLVFRFRETHRPLYFTYNRFTIIRLLRFVHQNIGTMPLVFSVNRLYGPILLAFMGANLPSNVMIGIYLLQNRFSAKQKYFTVALFLGQLTCFLGTHLVAAMFSKKIHSPYKRIQSLSILIHRCPLRARIHLANAIQTFNVKTNKYGITYGRGKWTFGLVTMMSFTKFILLYGELMMYNYHQMDRSS